MNTKILSLPILVLVSLVLFTSCATGFENNKNTSQVQPTTPVISTQSSSPTTTPVSMIPETPKNISKSISYTTDRGKERVTASFVFTIDSTDTITVVSVSPVSANSESRQYISRFNSAAKSKIVGKKISSLSLSTVGGASDTTDAFQEVISSL